MAQLTVSDFVKQYVRALSVTALVLIFVNNNETFTRLSVAAEQNRKNEEILLTKSKNYFSTIEYMSSILL